MAIAARLAALAICIPLSTQAAPERHYQDLHCDGETEVVLSDRTRVDCLTAEVAWEYEFARSWYPSIGQALHYARQTGTQPGIVLIIESPEECAYLRRLLAVRDAYLPILVVEAIGECGEVVSSMDEYERKDMSQMQAN